MRATAIVTGLALCLAMHHARAEGPLPDAMQVAREHFEAGKRAYDAGNYWGAIREYKAAEALYPEVPLFAYNLGLGNEKLGKRRVAVSYYRRYLELLSLAANRGRPLAANPGEVKVRISQLELELAAQPQPSTQTDQSPPTVEQPVAMPPPIHVGTSEPVSPPAKRARDAGIVLTALGLLGVALIGVSYAAVPSCNLADNRCNRDSVDIKRAMGMSLSGNLGVIFLSVGIPFWATGQAKLDRQRSAGVTSVRLAPTGMLLTF